MAGSSVRRLPCPRGLLSPQVGAPPLERALDSHDRNVWSPLKLALPNPYHEIPGSPRRSPHVRVTPAVSRDLGCPVHCVRLGHMPATRAAMPEAAVCKDGDLRAGKDEIRRTRLARPVHRPSAQPRAREESPHAPLGRHIAAGPDRRHVAAARWRWGREPRQLLHVMPLRGDASRAPAGPLRGRSARAG